MPQKKRYSTIDASEKKSSNSLRTESEHSGNNYLTLSKLKYSINSLSSSLNKKVKFDSFNNVEPEKLYEENILLKKEINEIKKELEEVKIKLAKKDLELKEKDKIIKDCLKVFNLDFDRKNLSTKAEESVLLSKVKKKYQDLKTQYESKCAENKVLNANIKLIKLNEFEIENDTLKEELNKLNLLYKLSVEENKNVRKEFDEFKEQFLAQHALISQLQKQIESLNNENSKLKDEKEDIERDYENNIIKQKKLEQSNKRNLRFMIQKNRIENYKKFEELIKSEKKLKNKCNKLGEENKSLKEQLNNKSPQKENIIIKGISRLEIESETKTNNEFELCKSLYEESKILNVLYEKYFKDHRVKPEDITKNDFEGILNSENRVFLLPKYSRNNKDDDSFSETIINYLKKLAEKMINTNKNRMKIKIKLKNINTNTNTIPNNSRTIDNNLTSNNNINEEEDKK